MKISVIEYCRIKYALSRQNLATLIGVTRLAIYQWEKGIIAAPCKKHLNMLSLIFKVDPSAFLTQIEVSNTELECIINDYNWRHPQYKLRYKKRKRIDAMQCDFLSMRL